MTPSSSPKVPAQSSAQTRSPTTTPPPAHEELKPTQSWSYPFAPGKGKSINTAEQYLALMAEATGGFYPWGRNGLWHGGIHFDGATAGVLEQGTGVKAIASGEVVAYRLDSRFQVLDYPDGKQAPYSTSFVLMRFKLALPPAPGTSSAAAPPADEVQTFYALYMHLLDWESYRNGDVPRPHFWHGKPHFRVADRAKDQQVRPRPKPAGISADEPSEVRLSELGLPNTTQREAQGHMDNLVDAATMPLLTGLHVREKASASSAILGILPRGSEVEVGPINARGWAQIRQIIAGTPVGKLWGESPDPALVQGWVYTRELESLIAPDALDQVVIVDPPFRVQAGDVLGHQGGYAHYRDAGPLPPESAGPPLVHLEVFTDDAFPAFLAKSRSRADTLPAPSKPVLVIAAGARLVAETPHADGQLDAGVKVKETADSPHSGRWVRVQALKDAVSADDSRRPGMGGKTGKASMPVGDPVWIERSELADTSRVRRSWSRFPLQLSAATEGPAGFGLALTRDSLDRHAALDKAVDEHGVPWWRVTVGTAQGAALRGWVCGKDHPQTSWQSPWAWPLFETVDATDASLLDCFKRILYVTGAVLPEDREDFSHAAAGVKESALVRALEEVIEQQDKSDGRLTAVDIKKALRLPWLAQPLSRLVVKYESEWGGSTEKWTKLETVMKTEQSQKRWQAEVGRIRKLCWWDEVASGIKDFPAKAVVWHLHPIGLVGGFNVLKLSIEEARVRAFLRVIRVGEGTELDKGYQTLYGGNVFSGYADHPRLKITAGKYTSTAAGAYQILEKTWNELVKKYGFKDFSPENQDRAAIKLLIRRGALDYIKRGDIEHAIRGDGKAKGSNKEWASQPESPYGQPTMTMERAEKLFYKFLEEELNGNTTIKCPVGSLF